MSGWRGAGGALLLAGIGAASAAAAAQVTGNGAAPAPVASPSPSPLPTPTASPAARLPVPPAPVIVLPRATPTPRSTPSARPTADRPSPKPSPTARVTPTPSPPATAAPSPAVIVSPSPAATLPPSPMPTETPPPAAVQPGAPPPVPSPDDMAYWLAALATAVLVALALGWVLLRRRRTVGGDEPRTLDGAAAAPQSRARLSLAFRPLRAGLNLVTATSENEVVLTNIGDAPAADVRLGVVMIAAHAGQDAELAAFYAAPVERPATPPFALAAGEERVVRLVTTLPRDAIRPLTAVGRPMFVPIVAVNATYATADIAAQTAQAFAVGIERVDSAKLGPFWLDALPKSYEQIAARAHAAVVER